MALSVAAKAPPSQHCNSTPTRQALMLGPSTRNQRPQRCINRSSIKASGYFYDSPKQIRVDGVALDNFLENKSFDMIFVDIEGSEYFAFKGMQKIFKRSKVLITEFIPHHIKNVASVSIDDFWSTLEPHFNYLYIPHENKFFKNSKDILRQLTYMFNNNQSYANIVFLKTKVF